MPQSGSPNKSSADLSDQPGKKTAENAQPQDTNTARPSNNEDLDKDDRKPGNKEGTHYANFSEFMREGMNWARRLEREAHDQNTDSSKKGESGPSASGS